METTTCVDEQVVVAGADFGGCAGKEVNSSGTSNATEINQFYFYETEQFTVLWLLFIIIVAGNLGVIYTLTVGSHRKSRMNYFITQLAYADLSVGLINVLTDIVWRITVSWMAGNVACKIIRFLQVVVTYGSTFVLVALSIDRYDAIRHPMKFSGSWRRAKCLIIAAWLFSVLFAIPILILYEEKVIQDIPQCWIEFDEAWHWKLYMTLVSLSLFVFPTAIIATCYAIIILTIWSKSSVNLGQQSSRKSNGTIMEARTGSDNSRRASSRGLIPRAKVKTVKITFVIVSAFILCWSPYIIFDLLQVYGHIPSTQTNIAIATFVQSLAPLNSAANPIIYILCSAHVSRNFSRKLWSLPPFKWICGKKKRRPRDSTTATQTSSMSEFLTNTNKKKSEVTSSTGPSQQTVLIHTKK